MAAGESTSNIRATDSGGADARRGPRAWYLGSTVGLLWLAFPISILWTTGLPLAAGQGRTSRGLVAEIAAELFLSEGTVRNYLSSAIGKTAARSRADAARIAEENGWLLG
ncbi:LuxR C-terminal-related transcriptional regulator [Subtercola sp. PAMC28395]|nr:LuxR C-terminal-related transcriptional regulator [Subtercola sp. PAMC28395]